MANARRKVTAPNRGFDSLLSLQPRRNIMTKEEVQSLREGSIFYFLDAFNDLNICMVVAKSYTKEKGFRVLSYYEIGEVFSYHKYSEEALVGNDSVRFGFPSLRKNRFDFFMDSVRELEGDLGNLKMVLDHQLVAQKIEGKEEDTK